ncbi:unnamed protein product, partial [Polarella glacialis]
MADVADLKRAYQVVLKRFRQTTSSGGDAAAGAVGVPNQPVKTLLAYAGSGSTGDGSSSVIEAIRTKTGGVAAAAVEVFLPRAALKSLLGLAAERIKQGSAQGSQGDQLQAAAPAVEPSALEEAEEAEDEIATSSSELTLDELRGRLCVAARRQAALRCEAAAAEALAAAQASAAEALRRESAELLQQEAALQRELGRQAVAAAAEAQQAAERRLELFNECQAGESALRESWEKIVAERAAAERRLAEQRKACEAPMAAAQKLRGVAVRAQKALQLLGSAVKGASDQRAVVLSNLAASSKVERICQEVTEDQKSDSSGTKGAAELALAIQDAQAEAHELRSGLAMSEAASQELKLALSSVASRVWLARRRAHEVPSLTAQLEAVQRQVWAVEDRQDASPPSSWALRCSLQLLSSSAEERALLQLQLREERVQQDAVLGAPYSQDNNYNNSNNSNNNNSNNNNNNSQGSAQSLAMRVTSPKLSRWVKVASSPFQEPPGDDCVDGEEQERCDLRAEAQLLQLRLAEEGCRLHRLAEALAGAKGCRATAERRLRELSEGVDATPKLSEVTLASE